MFAVRSPRIDFADTRLTPMEPQLALPGMAGSIGRYDALDALEQMAQADAADRSLLRLVLCAAVVTLLLALATSVGL